jgi:2-polyprenyl-3-methyl-5-hydroxy-6-metoxy-1,4-benzoquinol methylase
MEAVNGFQRTAVVRAAVEFDLFTAVGEGADTAEALAGRLGIAVKGARVLADALVIIHLLEKRDGRYLLTAESAFFLDRRSPRYLGDTIRFLLSEPILHAYAWFPDAVRKGGTAASAEGALAAEHPMWVEFARAMAPLMFTAVQTVVEVAMPAGDVLDVAAGHGRYGIALLESGAARTVVALDWPNVLEVARANAAEAGVLDQWRALPGNALTTPLGGDYDTVLLPNFLHHFDPDTCRTFLQRIHAALRPGGRAVIVEYLPDDDRVTPSAAAWFAVQMLATTPSGDAYTLAEYTGFLTAAGFTEPSVHKVPGAARHVLVAERRGQ